ncbi:hypothetical protein RJ639_021155 [Escallonia herrerae]|uniref:Small auxin up regulated protein n=1 Tax=Escallonia herrerae TaxID=1293975 RepID=A0AA88V4L0_9ASTE|nr:hypothetical protein RJ639_021155 [Escallonia herrerae]
MDDNGGCRVTGIRQIVRLKEILHRWQNVTLGPKGTNLATSSQNQAAGISPAISKRLRGCNVYCDSDEDGCQSPELPHDVPKGYLAVYVGLELRRFIIPTSYLSDPLFKVLLEKVEEEFGFDHSGGLTIPCEIETFKYLLKCMENHQKDQADQEDAGKHFFLLFLSILGRL